MSDALDLAPGRVALLLCGGGITGAAYEIGCLAALDRWLDGFVSRRVDCCVGVSAGSIVGALIASGAPPEQLYRAWLDDEAAWSLRRDDVYAASWRAVLSAGWTAARRCADSWWRARRGPSPYSPSELLTLFQEQLPAGVFDLDPLRAFVRRMLAREGVADDFAALARPLLVPAIDIDTGERVIFGAGATEGVAISDAVAASCAIPGFFRPHRIGAARYVDGSMGGHTHVDLPIACGATLVVVVNPLVPVRNDGEQVLLPTLTDGRGGSVADLGVAFVSEQARRIQGCVALDDAVARYAATHPHVDVVRFEPERGDTLLFLQSPMSFAHRRLVAEYAYHLTERQLERQRDLIAAALRRHDAGAAEPTIVAVACAGSRGVS